MGKGTNLASMACSLSLGALLIWLAWPQKLPTDHKQGPQADKTTATEKQPAAVPEKEAPKPMLAAVTLPPPPAMTTTSPAPKQTPEAIPSPSPQSAKVSVKPLTPPKPKAQPPVQGPSATQPVRRFKSLRPTETKGKPPVEMAIQARKPLPVPKKPETPEPNTSDEPQQPPYMMDSLPASATEARKQVNAASRELAAADDRANENWRDQVDQVKPSKRVSVTASRHSSEAKAGRILLRLLEHGQGPVIEIAWPGSAGENERLYHRFQQCFGMVNAIVTTDGHLYAMQSPVGKAWSPNIDRYSGFVRQPAGRPVPAEQRNASEIRRRHGLGNRGKLVRVFPRNVDAAILGGLQTITGNNYRGIKTIHAAYQMVGGGLEVTNIIIDGTSYSETIAVAPVRRCGDV